MLMSSPLARARLRSSATGITVESSQVPLALKPSASALMALIAFSSLDHCRLPELVVGYLGNVCLVLVVRNVHWIYNHT